MLKIKAARPLANRRADRARLIVASSLNDMPPCSFCARNGWRCRVYLGKAIYLCCSFKEKTCDLYISRKNGECPCLLLLCLLMCNSGICSF